MPSVTPPRLAKLSRPRLHSPVRRERLFRLLDKRVTRPVVWVSGPPGAGKSTLVASYLEARKLPGGWFRVDAGDRDAATFFHYLKRLAGQIGGRRRAELPDLTTDYLADVPGFARRFFRTFFGLFREQAVVVFDNCQDAAAAGFHDLLREACGELPEALTLVMISREPAPEALARWRTGGAMLDIGPQDLRLTNTEARALAASANQAALDTDALNDRVQGWLAGFVLLLAQPAAGDGQAPAGLAHEELFGYFAGEILSRVEPPVRRVLLATSLFPAFTPSMAQRLSGEARAGHVLDWLYRCQYFIERKAEGELTYRYHDLFRAFLRGRLDDETDDDTRRRLYSTAAEVLRERSDPEAAVILLQQAGDWDGAGRIILDEAQALVQSGRLRTLTGWFDGMPESVLAGEPWLRFWKAVARGFAESASARAELERCYIDFVASGDLRGQLWVANAFHDIVAVSGEGLDALYRWAQVIGGILASQPADIEFEAALHGWRLVALSYSLHDGQHPLIDQGHAFLLDALFEHHLSDYDTLVIGSAIAAHCWITADIPLFERVSARVHPLVLAGRVSPAVQCRWLTWHGVIFETVPRPDIVEADAKRLLEVAQEYRLTGFEGWACGALALRYRSAAQIEKAEAYVERLQALARSGTEQMRFLATTNTLLLHARKREFDAASALMGLAIQLIEKQGVRPSGAYLRLLGVELAARDGDMALAKQILANESAIVAAGGVRFLDAAIPLLEAWLALLSGEETTAAVRMLDALREAEKPGRLGYLSMYPCLQEMCAFAFRTGLARERVSPIARLFALEPPDPDDLHWPRLIEIRTLGSFEVRSSDRPLAFGRKTPRRLLSLLDLLVCAGPAGLPRQQVTDTLWEDSDGAAADDALKTTLRRLRDWFGHDAAVVVHQGRLRLDASVVRVDAWMFESLIERATNRQDTAAQASALELYQGEFLGGRSDLVAVVSWRERLKGLFLQHADAHGLRLESAYRWTEALSIHNRAAQAEPLAEAPCRGQMRCLIALGREDDARVAFLRLSGTLRKALGTQPSKATIDILGRLTGH